MRKLVSFMHVSLDGFVAGPNGEMDWIKVGDDMFEMAGQQTDDSDIALYGRVTFEMMDAYWPTAADQPNASAHDIQHSNWYNDVPKVVLSKSLQKEDHPNVTIVDHDVTAVVEALKNVPGKNMVLFGSPSVVHFLSAHDLMDEYWLFINPILLGEGIPMFKGLKERTSLELASSKVFGNGVVCLQYVRK